MKRPIAGRLDRRIVLRAWRQTGTDSLNAPIEAWVDVADMWASRRDVSDQEKLQSGVEASTLRSRFTLRQSSRTQGISGDDRLRHDGADWDIVGVKELDRYWLEITAERRSDG